MQRPDASVYLGRNANDREAAEMAADFGERYNRTGAHLGKPNFAKDFVRLKCRREFGKEELRHRDASTSVRPLGDQFGIYRQSNTRQFGRGVGVA